MKKEKRGKKTISIKTHLLFLVVIAIWCAWPVGWTIATGMSVFFYKKNFRSEIKKIKRD